MIITIYRNSEKFRDNSLYTIHFRDYLRILVFAFECASAFLSLFIFFFCNYVIFYQFIMAYLKLNCSLKKNSNCLLLEKLQFSDEPNNKSWFFFKPSDQHICYHLKYFNFNINKLDFVNSSTVERRLEDYTRYFKDNKLFFNNYFLIKECEYKSNYYRHHIPTLNNHLRNCLLCKKLNTYLNDLKLSKINKDKISANLKYKLEANKNQILLDIGAGYPNCKLISKYKTSKSSIKDFKRRHILLDDNKLNNFLKKSNKKKFKSLTELDQMNILDYVEKNNYYHLKDIKIDLKLECSTVTISNFLKSQHYRLYNTPVEPYLDAEKLKIKEDFCKLISKATISDWRRVVFSDEKILQSYHNAKVKIVRKRFNKKKKSKFTKRYEIYLNTK